MKREITIAVKYHVDGSRCINPDCNKRHSIKIEKEKKVFYR